MDSKEFKKLFSEIALLNDFNKAYSGWYKKTNECIAILELQKSNFGNYYLLNIKIFIDGIFNRNYLPSKELIKSPMGHITNQISEISVLDFEKPIEDYIRKDKLENLFLQTINPFTDKVLSISGIKELVNKGDIFLLSAIIDELEKQKTKIYPDGSDM